MIIKRFLEEVFFAEIYQPVRELGGKEVAIDLGSCTGEFSLWASQQFKKIYAIEPVKEYFAYLKENVKGFDHIKPFYLALSDTNRLGHMTGADEGGARLSEDITPALEEVETQTLTTFMKKNKINKVDCLKVDIEGDEKQVFEALDFPEVADKIKYIIGEHVGNTSKGVLESLGFKMREYKSGFIFERSEA